LLSCCLLLQIIDAVGHNDVSPARIRAIDSAHAARHIVLLTGAVHNKEDINRLMRTPAFLETFKAFNAAKAQLGVLPSGPVLTSHSVAVALTW
jgi:hypothetical protein